MIMAAPGGKSVYVAGAWKHRGAIHARIEQVRKLGFAITHDWTVMEGAGMQDRTDEENTAAAHMDIDGVMKADILVMDLTDEDYKYAGTWTELGIALGKKSCGQGMCIVLIGDVVPQTQNIFCRSSLVDCHASSWDEALHVLPRL